MKPIAPAALVILAAAAQAQTVTLTPIPTGAMPKLGGYSPQRLTLSADKPATITKMPEGVSAPMYGILTIGPAGTTQVFHLVVDEPEGKDAVLYIDSNGNGDMTDDKAADWAPKKTKNKEGAELTQYNGGGTIEIKYDDTTLPAHLGMYRFDKTDPARAQLKDVVLYYADYAYEGELALGDKKYRVMVADDMATGDFRGKKDGKSSGVRLLIDVNGNQKFDVRGETFDIREPFNIGGTTYQITDVSPSGAKFNVGKSDKQVAEIALPPDHSVGKKITGFEAKTMDGKAISFPSSYKGKIVMIDFWATWCRPCMDEVPNLAKVYDELHPKGFEILGISLDQKDAEEKIKKVTGEHKMTWPQVYDGKFWSAEIADMYVIKSIPAAFLVDGDTGEILADTRGLRGEALKKTVEAALAKKYANTKG